MQIQSQALGIFYLLRKCIEVVDIMTGNVPSVAHLRWSTSILQSDINLAFSCSDEMSRSFDETPSRAVSRSLGKQTMMRLRPGQLGSTDLSVENCLQQMHFITQLHLFLELALHIDESGGPVLPSCSDHSYVIPVCLWVFWQSPPWFSTSSLASRSDWYTFWTLPLANIPQSSSWLPYWEHF